MAVTLEAKKLELIQWLSELKDVELIDALVERMEQAQDENPTPEEALASIDRGAAQADAGELTPHAEARKRYERYL